MKNPNYLELIEKYKAMYPLAYKLTLAKLIYDDNQEMFTSYPSRQDAIEALRVSIRYYSGSGGHAKRQMKNANALEFMGQIVPTHQEALPPLKLKEGVTLIIGDIHGHKHSQYLKDYFLFAKDRGIDSVILNGDIIDFEEMSRFPQSQRRERILDEVSLVKELLADINDFFPNIKKIYKKGNHELWFDKHLWSNPILADLLVGLKELNFQSLLGLNDLGWTFVDDRQVIELGKLMLIHGHEAKKGGKYVANALLEYFKRDVAFGHFHRIDFAKFDIYGGRTIRSHALPCACDLNAAYTGINNQWSDGFAICTFNEEDYKLDVYVQNDGKIRKV